MAECRSTIKLSYHCVIGTLYSGWAVLPESPWQSHLDGRVLDLFVEMEDGDGAKLIEAACNSATRFANRHRMCYKSYFG